MVALECVLEGAHYPSDVIAAAVQASLPAISA